MYCWFQKLKDFGIAPFMPKDQIVKKNNKLILKQFFWFVCISRNALIVISTTILAYFLTVNDYCPFTLTSKYTHFVILL